MYKQICFNFPGLFAINLLYSFFIFGSNHSLTPTIQTTHYSRSVECQLVHNY